MNRLKKTFLLIIALSVAMFAKAQSYSNDFENQDEWLAPWFNIHIVPDGDTTTGNHVCFCDSIFEYGPGFEINVGQEYPHQNIQINYSLQFKTDSVSTTQANLVFSIENGNKPYWLAYPLSLFASDTTEWSLIDIDLVFPNDYIGSGQIKSYIWNLGLEKLYFDNAEIEVNTWQLPCFQPIIDSIPITHSLNPSFQAFVEYIDRNGDTLTDPKVMETKINLDDNGAGRIQVTTETTFKEDVKLLRLALIMPLPEGELTIFRRNQHLDTTNFQNAYYLDREGFSVTNNKTSLCTYHNTGISSIQLDVEHRTACFNIDYWCDHPLLHYPMRSDTTDYFEDISYREIKAGEVLTGQFNFFLLENTPDELPRLMPVWDGYQSAFIFTEHADWTDISTHRAVLFGNENITIPEEAVGGFCYFNIPVTKSVFYWNPDNITNEKTSEGLFPGLIASVKTDKEFYKLLKNIKKQGFEICLHSPEIYTTIPNTFTTAMRFMRRNFKTVSWIDHGYNNGPDKNREDLVCDGLLPESPQYAVPLWKKYGVRYLWNAYYEENRQEDMIFDGHFVQPYDGFGDAMPNRQITTLPNNDQDFLLWSTPSTLEVNEDHEWYYYFDSTRLQRLVDNHNVFITHVYPAWTDPWRAFWQYNGNGTAVAMPGFNFALNQLSHFRNEKKILPTTIEAYLSHYEKLLNVEYNILSDNSIQLINHGEAIQGLTLLGTCPFIVEGKVTEFRKTKEGYLVWFDLGKKEKVIIRNRK